MSLLPLSSRLPARKHLLAAVFGLLGLALMAGAVMTASGLTLPFTSRDPANVRAGSIVVDAPTTTTAGASATPTTSGRNVPRALDPAGFPAPTSTPVQTTTPGRPPSTSATSTTLPAVPTTPPLLPLGSLGQGLNGR